MDRKEYFRVAKKNLRMTRMLDQMCTECGDSPPETGRRRCRLCLDYQNSLVVAKYRKRLESGLCPKCGKSQLDKNICDTCLSIVKRNRDKTKMAAFDAYGGRACSSCRFSDVRALSIDHIN